MYIIDSSIRHSTLIEYLEPFSGGFRLGYGLDHIIKDIPILDPQRVGDKSAIRLPFGEAYAIAEDAEKSIVTTPE